MTDKSFESKQRKIILETKFNHSGKRRGTNWLVAKTMFLIAGVIFLLSLFYDKAYAYISFTNLHESAASSNLSQSAMTNMFADNLFILGVPIAIFIFVYQTFVFHQIKENTSNKKGGA